MMKMVKALLVGIVTILLISFYAYANLKHNSVYYAQQMPHKEGTEPDLVMLIENMWWVYTPEIEGIRYDDDGHNFIENSTGLDSNPTNFSEFDGSYSYRDQNDIAYKFGKNFSLE